GAKTRRKWSSCPLPPVRGRTRPHSPRTGATERIVTALPAPARKPILEVRDLKKYYPITRGLLRRTVGQVKAVDGVSFEVLEGETLGLVGESGCGKTTTGNCILRGIEPTSGEVIFHDTSRGPVDIVNADSATLRHVRLNMQKMFQDPYGSLNPRMTLLQIVGEPLVVNRNMRGRELEASVAELLRVVGLRPEYMHRFPTPSAAGRASASAVPQRSCAERRFSDAIKRCR